LEYVVRYLCLITDELSPVRTTVGNNDTLYARARHGATGNGQDESGDVGALHVGNGGVVARHLADDAVDVLKVRHTHWMHAHRMRLARRRRMLSICRSCHVEPRLSELMVSLVVQMAATGRRIFLCPWLGFSREVSILENRNVRNFKLATTVEQTSGDVADSAVRICRLSSTSRRPLAETTKAASGP